MGILNVTPDSFSDGGRFSSPEAAIEAAAHLESEGASIIDVGGESTRPGAQPVTAQEELRRVIPVIRGIRRRSQIPISIDSMKSEVADAALSEGADIINDVSALRHDPEMLSVCLKWRPGVVLMHMQGTPATMQKAPTYQNATAEVEAFLQERLSFATTNGIEPEFVVLDPGIGFGKSAAHNIEILSAIPLLSSIGRPLLLGISRKSILTHLASAQTIAERYWPGVTLTSLAREMGARIFRVHEPAPHLQALRMTEAILAA